MSHKPTSDVKRFGLMVGLLTVE